MATITNKEQLPTLGQVAKELLWETKWLVGPSVQVANQWMESWVRAGHPLFNLRPVTHYRLAMELIANVLAAEQRTVAPRWLAASAVELAWPQLPSDGYLGKLELTTNLSRRVADSLMSLRLADVDIKQLQEADSQESAAKLQDLYHCHEVYRDLLDKHRLVDEAEVYRLAISYLESKTPINNTWRFLFPGEIRADGLASRFVDALPSSLRVSIGCPVASLPGDEAITSNLKFFRTVGDTNQVREVLRCCVADGIPLDDVEVVHTDAHTFTPLIQSLGHRYLGDAAGAVDVPLTFADGLPPSLSRPGRALIAWLDWVASGYPQPRLAALIEEGLLERPNDSTSFSQLQRLLRPLAIGHGRGQYLPTIDCQIESCRQEISETDENERLHLERRLTGLRTLRELIAELLEISARVETANGRELLDAASTFLTRHCRSVGAIDIRAREILIQLIDERRQWLAELGVDIDLRNWLTNLPESTKVMESGPRPGCVHIAPLGTAGHSGRSHTFLIGMDDRRFPGPAIQDPVLLDEERVSLSGELETSAQRIQRRVEELKATVRRLRGTCTISWSCLDLQDGRESFAAPAILPLARQSPGFEGMDMDRLNREAGVPRSFAPEVVTKSLDESECWVWRLTDPEGSHADERVWLDERFPLLARGQTARTVGDGRFDAWWGHVPAAGERLDPSNSERPYSASALETLGRCPLAFFFRDVLRIATPDEVDLDPDQWLDVRQVGLLMHDVFRRFLSDLSEQGERPDFDRDHQRLASHVLHAVNQWRKDIPPLNEHSFRARVWQLLRTARIFLQDEQNHCQTQMPKYFEIAIGLDRPASSDIDDSQPVQVELRDGHSIRLRGQIDRIDEGDAGRYSVWDYKLGSGYGYEDADPFRQGRRTQNLLYLLMARHALQQKVSAEAVVERFGYFFPSTRALGRRVVWDADLLEQEGLPILDRLAQVIANGTFISTDETADCKFCDFKAVCRHLNQVCGNSRAVLDGDGESNLNPIRELRRDQ